MDRQTTKIQIDIETDRHTDGGTDRQQIDRLADGWTDE